MNHTNPRPQCILFNPEGEDGRALKPEFKNEANSACCDVCAGQLGLKDDHLNNLVSTSKETLFKGR